jgi:hypothetical protein
VFPTDLVNTMDAKLVVSEDLVDHVELASPGGRGRARYRASIEMTRQVSETDI